MTPRLHCPRDLQSARNRFDPDSQDRFRLTGIVGLLRREGDDAPPGEIQRLLAPFAQGASTLPLIWTQRIVALGVQPSGIQADSSVERVHLTVDREGDLAIVCDARLDNRPELIRQLDLPADAAPPQIVLSAYQRWGADCPRWLIGDFRFILWDGRAGTLVCASDHAGVKPLYYVSTPTLFAAASDVDALLCAPGIERELNPAAIAEYLGVQDADPGCATLFKGISRLPARHSLTVSSGQIRLQEYWRLDPDAEIRLKSDEEYDEAFREVFRLAVACRIDGVPVVGSMLSGGLDSSAVSAVAGNLLAESGGKLHTYYLASASPDCDESPFANSVHRQAASIHHELPYTSPMTNAARWIEPNRALTSVLFYDAMLSLFEAARSHGVTVMLTGVDGDNTVGHGRGLLTELTAMHAWDRLTEEIDGMSQHFGGTASGYLGRFVLPMLSVWARQGHWGSFKQGMDGIASRWQIPRRQIIWKYGLRPLVPLPARGLLRRLRRASASEDAIMSQFDADRSNRVGRADELQTFPLTARQEQIEGLMAVALQATYAEYTHVAERAGIEVRHPFSDRRLIEFCVALPAEQKARQGWTRLIMRRALSSMLPESVAWRSGKQAYPVHLLDRAREDLPLIRKALADETALGRYVDMEALRRHLARFEAEPRVQEALLLVRAARLNLWLTDQD